MVQTPLNVWYRVRGGVYQTLRLRCTTAVFVYMTHSAVVSRFETALPLRTREKGWDVSDPPKNRGVMRSRTDGICTMPLYRPPWGRSRPHLSLREGSEQAPFPLALHRVGSVLAVKGSLRRFAPWTAPGRSERRAAYEGKGGLWVRAVWTGRKGTFRSYQDS